MAHPFQIAAFYIALDDHGLSADDLLFMRQKLGEAQAAQLDSNNSWVTSTFNIDPFDPIFNSWCNGTELGLNVGAAVCGTYGLVKGVAALNQVIRMPGQILKAPPVLGINPRKITYANSNPWTNSINPFKGKTFEEIDQLLRTKNFSMKGPDPLHGKGSYFLPTTNRKYYLDYAGKAYKGGVTELPHVDVYYNIPLNRIEKQRLPIGECLYEFK